MNTFQDHFFNFGFRGDLNLLYCGNREKSIDHKYTHTQNAYLLTYVAEGKATLSVGNQKMPLKAGDFFVSYPASGASYTTKSKIPWSIRWVTMTGSQLEELLPMIGFTPSHPILTASNPLEAERILKELFDIALKDDLKNKLSALSLVYELLSSLALVSPATDTAPAVSEAVSYVSEHYGDRHLSVRSLADAAFLNPNYFSKLFLAHTGLSPSRFILKTRMEKAKKLLRFTELSVGEIATEVGYSDALYFSRTFRRYAGLSPTAFRNRAD